MDNTHRRNRLTASSYGEQLMLMSVTMDAAKRLILLNQLR